TSMTCHPPIRAAATCTVPRTPIISHQPPPRGSYVAASYWTAASDVAVTLAPATVGQRRSTPPATGQWWRITVPPPAQYLVHKSLAASHVAASYWTAASDVAATSAPVNVVGQRRSTPPATSQRWRITVVIGGQRWRSTMVNVAGHRSTAADHGGDRRSTVAVNTVAGGEPPLTAAGPPLTTTGPPVNGGW
nr:hypothetical protein [Tanacetum cinerariifolium]